MKTNLKVLKKHTLFLFLILTFSNVNAQNNWDKKEKTYTNGVLLDGLLDMETKKIVSLNPKGKNVSITYDPFYNTYKINWDEIDGKMKMYLKPKTETPDNGTIFIDANANDEMGQFFIIDTFNKNKKIQLISAYPLDYNGKKYKMIFVFEDFN